MRKEVLNTHPRVFGRIGVLEECPDPGSPDAPPAHFPAVLLQAEPLQVSVPHERRVVIRHVRLRRLEAVQRLLRVPVLPVVHPAARLHVGLVDAPEGELLLEQRAAHVVGAVQLARPVVVEDEREDGRVPVEEELIGLRVVVEVAEGVRFSEPRQTRPGQRLQRAPVRLVPHAAAVDDDFLAFRRASHVGAVTCFVGRLIPTLAPFE